MQVVNSNENNLSGLLVFWDKIQHTSAWTQKGNLLAPIWNDSNGRDAWLQDFVSPSLICLSLLAFVHSCYRALLAPRGVLPPRAPSSHPVIFKMQEASRTLLCWHNRKIAGRVFTGFALTTCEPRASQHGRSLWTPEGWCFGHKCTPRWRATEKRISDC